MALGRLQEKVLDYIIGNPGTRFLIGKQVVHLLENNVVSARGPFEPFAAERPDHVWRAVSGLESRGFLTTEDDKGIVYVNLTQKCRDEYIYKNFAPARLNKPVAPPMKRKKLVIGFILDHSGSMRGIETSAKNAFNQELAAIQKNAAQHDITTVASVVRCGVGVKGSVVVYVDNKDVSTIEPVYSYDANGHYTPLWDSIHRLIGLMDYSPVNKEVEDVSYLAVIITDGSNNSGRISHPKLASIIKERQNRGNWTFSFRVPDNYPNVITSLGVPKGNILCWDATPIGTVVASVSTVNAMDAFYADTARGVTSTNAFYEVNAKDLKISDVKSRLVDISNEVDFVIVGQFQDGVQIRTWMELRFNEPYVKGTAFYALTKKEDEVQPYKIIVIQEKATGRVYAGDAARDLLNLPKNTNIKIRPGDHGGYDIYVQTTSVNRKLVGGTTVLRWKNVRNI